MKCKVCNEEIGYGIKTHPNCWMPKDLEEINLQGDKTHQNTILT